MPHYLVGYRGSRQEFESFIPEAQMPFVYKVIEPDVYERDGFYLLNDMQACNIANVQQVFLPIHLTFYLMNDPH